MLVYSTVKPEPAFTANFQNGCVVFLNGYPGVGNLSIARELQAQLAKQNCSVRVFDNHLSIDPAQAIHPDRGPQYLRLRAQLRRIAFKELKALDCLNPVIILTAGLSENEEDIAVFAEHVDIARARGVPLLCYTLVADTETLCGRLQSDERAAKGKLMEPELLKSLVAEHRVLEIETKREAFAQDVVMRHSVLDTTGRSLEETAARIYEDMVDANAVTVLSMNTALR